MPKMIKGERGFSLIEVLVALALLGIIAAGFLMAINTAAKAVFVADERTTAESLARSQLEYVKTQEYITDEEGDGSIYIEISLTDYPGYTIESYDYTESLIEDIIAVPWDSEYNQPSFPDNGLQRIKLVIKHHGEEILSLEGYKVYEVVY